MDYIHNSRVDKVNERNNNKKYLDGGSDTGGNLGTILSEGQVDAVFAEFRKSTNGGIFVIHLSLEDVLFSLKQ